MAQFPSGYQFPILNSDGSASTTIVDMADMFVRKELFLNAGLYAWGQSNQGQLGLNNQTNYSSPVQVGALTNWKQVAASQNYSLAVKTDGTLWAWGQNTYGQLGNGNVTNFSSPVQIGLLTNWRSISASTGIAGGDVSAAIKTDGSLWMWGYNGTGKLGQGFSGTTAATGGYYSSPIQVGALTNWKQVSTNINCDHVLAINTLGQLYAWGLGAFGVLGGGPTGTYGVANYSSPIQVGLLTNWKQVTNGQAFSIAIKTDGTAWAWGGNSGGQLGIGNNSAYSSPVQIGALTNWRQVSSGLYHTMAVKTDGTLWAWGDNIYGELGLGYGGAGSSYNSPVQVGTLTNWKQVSAGYYFSTAIKTDGTLWAWGYNQYGILGGGYSSNTLYYSSPIQVGALTNWKQVSAGTADILAISSPELPF